MRGRISTKVPDVFQPFRSIWWLVLLYSANSGSLHVERKATCQPGYYCPVGGFVALPCPKGTYNPAPDGVSAQCCLKCPPHHYCPHQASTAPMPCGPVAEQPQSGQDKCVCPGPGQSFQSSDSSCRCSLGFQPANDGVSCAPQLYDVCRDGKTRTQHGDCLDRLEWSRLCRQQVCLTAEDYRGYDAELGLCQCREPPGRAACGGLCRSSAASDLQLQCGSGGALQLVWSLGGQVPILSGSVMETVFGKWDSQGTLLCSSHFNSSRSVFIVQTTDEGFIGLQSGLHLEVQELFSPLKNSNGDDVVGGGNVSPGIPGLYSSREKRNNAEGDFGGRAVTGVLNPAACLHLGDVLLFSVDSRHYPTYDIDSLYNTNSDFDWGPFRRLKEELTLSRTPPDFLAVFLDQPGVYVFRLSSHPHRRLYVRVMPAGGQCYDPGTFFPTAPRHLIRMGISKRRSLLLRPDWWVTGGVLSGAVVVLCLCVTTLILFNECGWPAKTPIRARYHAMQLMHVMDDYASRGSRVVSQRKLHRNHPVTMRQSSMQRDTSDEFWDYEHQVDLEAFSSHTFYSLLLKQSLMVTTRLGKLTAEVKELYRGVVEKLQPLHPRLLTEETTGASSHRLRGEVEREVARRKALASQLRILLENQLQVLTVERRCQQRVSSEFLTQLKESSRVLSWLNDHDWTSNHHLYQSLMQRQSSLLDEMSALVSTECHRQGAWGLLGEGSGAKLLCTETGAILTKYKLFAPDGSLRGSLAVQRDSVTGLIRANPHSHMLLSSGHSMAVPPDFCIHPRTGNVVPIAGNVACDPHSSTLVFTTDVSAGEDMAGDAPLIPYIPYPKFSHSDQPLPSSHFRDLRPGQRLQLGAPMADPNTGVPVPVLAVTIHPESGQVFPLGGTHVCPITRMLQPIQIGNPMLDPKTGRMVLTVGVGLDPLTGAVLPVGGVVLLDSFTDALSGQSLRLGGASTRAGQLVPHAGGYQTLLDSKMLAAMLRIVEILKPLEEECGSDPTFQNPHGGGDRERQRDLLSAAAKTLHQLRGRSLHCQLQLQTRLELLLDWTVAVQHDGGALGEIPLPGTDVHLPALLGMEYPDPLGSGLSVPVLGGETHPVTGETVVLAGTMEDPDGRGLVAITYGCQTVDPVTGLLAPVVGARLDVLGKAVIPLTASCWLLTAHRSSSVQMEALQREMSARSTYARQLRQREDDLLSDLDSAVFHSLLQASNVHQVPWSGRQLRAAAVELQELTQMEAQRRDCTLPLLLPPHALHIFTGGDEDEWEQLRVWHSALLSSLDNMDASMERLQHEQDKWMSLNGPTTFHSRAAWWKEFWEQSFSRLTQLDSALNTLRCVRQLSELRAETAEAVLSGSFWYKEFGLVLSSRQEQSVTFRGLLQHKTLPLLERLKQLLEDKQFTTVNAARNIPGISSQLLCKPVKAQSQDSGLQHSSAPTHNSHTASSDFELPAHLKDPSSRTLVSLPDKSDEEWSQLLELSPVFHRLKEVELQLKHWVSRAGLPPAELADGGEPGFVDVADCQWECDGELIPLDSSILNPREFLVYQHGLYLVDVLHRQKLTPAVSLQIAASLPKNNYFNNAFRNSFFYQEAVETLFIRRQRLQSAGGFSLLLLHSLCHVKVGDLRNDSSPAFQRLFFKVLQACLGQVLQARLGLPPSAQEAHLCMQEKEAASSASAPSSLAASLLHRQHPGLLSTHEITALQRKHIETSLFSRLEDLLSEKSTAGLTQTWASSAGETSGQQKE